MMQLRIINSTIIDIINMSENDRRIGLKAITTMKRQNKFKILFEGYHTIKYLKTNENEQEWDRICARNIQQAINLGFLKKNIDGYDYDLFTDHGSYLGHYEKKIKIVSWPDWGDDYHIKINCDNDEIILINPRGWNNKNGVCNHFPSHLQQSYINILRAK